MVLCPAKDSITVEVIERGSAVHCISAYVAWLQRHHRSSARFFMTSLLSRPISAQLAHFRPCHVAIVLTLSFTKEGDIVIVGSDGVFDNLYLAAWLAVDSVNRLAVITLVHMFMQRKCFCERCSMAAW